MIVNKPGKTSKVKGFILVQALFLTAPGLATCGFFYHVAELTCSRADDTCTMVKTTPLGETRMSFRLSSVIRAEKTSVYERSSSVSPGSCMAYCPPHCGRQPASDGLQHGDRGEKNGEQRQRDKRLYRRERSANPGDPPGRPRHRTGLIAFLFCRFLAFQGPLALEKERGEVPGNGYFSMNDLICFGRLGGRPSTGATGHFYRQACYFL